MSDVELLNCVDAGSSETFPRATNFRIPDRGLHAAAVENRRKKEIPPIMLQVRGLKINPYIIKNSMDSTRNLFVDLPFRSRDRDIGVIFISHLSLSPDTPL